LGGSEKASPPPEVGIGEGLSIIRDCGRRGSKPNLLLSKLDMVGGGVEGDDVGTLDGLMDSSAPFRGSVGPGIPELFGLFTTEFQRSRRQLQLRCRLPYL